MALAELLGARSGDEELHPLTASLVAAVAEHTAEVDEVLATYAQGWTLGRMPAVDRAVLRVGAAELVYQPDTPAGVAISEAVGIATELSTNESPTFVNGLLARVAEVRHTLG